MTTPYPAEYTKSGALKHSADCRMVFGRKDPNCPRCVDLVQGAAPRQWASTRRQENDRRRCTEIREHFQSHKHLSGGCGPVCTFGDW